MAKKESEGVKQYVWPHPRYGKKVADKKWLEGRSKCHTGFCTPHNPLESQAHEGTKPVSASGVPMMVCPHYDTCPCYCHYEVDQMFELAGLPREPVEQSPEYVALVDARARETRAMLDELATARLVPAPLSNVGVPDARRADEGTSPGQRDAATGTPAPVLQPVFAPTPTGRRARGQLEYDVLKVCADYDAGVYDWTICTPKLVAESIGKMNGTEPPSTGAINAVWDRWEKLDFAKQDKKPSRFVGFTGEHTAIALEAAKGRAKRAKKRGESEAKRGSLRPRGR